MSMEYSLFSVIFDEHEKHHMLVTFIFFNRAITALADKHSSVPFSANIAGMRTTNVFAA